MWQVRSDFDRPHVDNPNGENEWSAVEVDTAEAAEAWWRVRTGAARKGTRVTMTDPQGRVVREFEK